MSESRLWDPLDVTERPGLTTDAIVAWVNANGGEARYVEGDKRPGHVMDSCIAIRTRDGKEAYCAPGQRVVMGEVFHPDFGVSCRHDDPNECVRMMNAVPEFTVEDS